MLFRLAISLFFVLWIPLAKAAQFESVIEAMAVKTSEDYINNDWESVSKIQGVTWEWPYQEAAAHQFTVRGTTRVGTDENPYRGATQVTVSGARTMIASVKISVANEALGLDALGEGKVTQIKTSCDADLPSEQLKFYRFEKPGYKPLYILYQSSWGASGSGAEDMEIVYLLDDILNFYPKTCQRSDY